MTIGGVHLLILGIGLALAAAHDVARRTVPNALVLPIALAGLVAQTLAGGLSGLGGALGAALATGLILLVPWRSGSLGGGDLKLAVAAATWLGPSRLLAFLVFTAIAGAPLALAVWGIDRWRRARGGAAPERATVPEAVAIALGALSALRWGLP